MSLTVKLILGLVIGAVVACAATLIQGNPLPDLPLLAACCTAALVSLLAVSLPGASSQPAAAGKRASGEPAQPRRSDANREFGQVKWFNASKGFGFIIKDDGDEIFVHFRSIRGEGRRGLKDGQRVSFVVVDSQKGPQAEDVTAEG